MAAKIVQLLILFVHFIYDNVLEFCLRKFWGPKKSVSAPDNDEELQIIKKSAVELAQLIKTRKLTSYEVVQAYTNRMKMTKAELNAITDGPIAKALDEAKAIDQRIQNGQIDEQEWAAKPFLGVPFTTKDSTEVAGQLYTLGLVSRKDTRGKVDAECVRLMKKAGGIILAMSNVPQVNKWLETRNPLFGQTNNPYDLRRSVGGSSGGEGALVAACCTAFGIGTDIGGSIRIPAFSCGIFGHKPTAKIVNTRGCTHRTGEEKSTMVVVGPMARYATDLLPLLKVLIEPNIYKSLKLDESVNIKKLRYFYIAENGMVTCTPMTAECERVMFKVRQHFKELTNQEVKLATLPHLKWTGRMWRYWMTQESLSFGVLLGNGVTFNPFVELVKKVFGCSELSMAAIYGLIDDILPKEKEALMLTATEECKKALKTLLGDDGVLFFPSSPRSVPFHYHHLFKFPDFHYFSIFNVLHVPVTQVPMGLNDQGLPLGIQVVASEKNDRLCLAVAEELEKAFGGWVPPF